MLGSSIAPDYGNVPSACISQRSRPSRWYHVLQGAGMSHGMHEIAKPQPHSWLHFLPRLLDRVSSITLHASCAHCMWHSIPQEHSVQPSHGWNLDLGHHSWNIFHIHAGAVAHIRYLYMRASALPRCNCTLSKCLSEQGTTLPPMSMTGRALLFAAVLWSRRDMSPPPRTCTRSSFSQT